MTYSVIDHGASEGVVANVVPRQPRAYIILLPDKRKDKSDVDIIFGNDYKLKFFLLSKTRPMHSLSVC